ncbi:MAG: phage terminase large subunit [Bdellovibrionales bacterium]|nr:phage terminase large subunit [Bdellovibrionales bacterium]
MKKAAEALLFNDRWRLSPARMAEHLTKGRFRRYPHIRLLDRRVAQGIAKGGARLVISMPPRHGKSWLTSLYSPAWFLSLWPNRNVILASYEATFAATWGRGVRNFLQENASALGVELASDSLASDKWNTVQGGGMITAGIGGPITGRGGHLIIIDDPVKNWEEASSETTRQNHIDWFNSTLYTRAEPGASIVILMTRWHERDLAGYLLNEHDDDWEEIRLPALAEDGDALERVPGEALCPERYDVEALSKIRAAIGSRMWEALYQQHPSAEEGNIFKRGWWKFYTNLPQRFDQIIQSWDLSFKDTKTADFVVGQVWGKIGADKYLIDQIRERMDFPTTVRAIKSLSARYPTARTKLVEDKANGPAVIAMLKHEVSGLIPVEPQGSKEARASAASPEIEAGNVWLPDLAQASWVQYFVEECAAFPNGAHDDCVDAMSQALIRLHGGPRLVSAPIVGFRGRVGREWWR